MKVKQELIKEALQAVQGAGELILEAWDKPRNIRHKGRIDLVTDTDLAYTAAGRFDAFFEIGLKPWDTAAGACLIREAGGRVSTMDGVDYVPGQETILGTNKVLHERMIRMLAGELS